MQLIGEPYLSFWLSYVQPLPKSNSSPLYLYLQWHKRGPRVIGPSASAAYQSMARLANHFKRVKAIPKPCCSYLCSSFVRWAKHSLESRRVWWSPPVSLVESSCQHAPCAHITVCKQAAEYDCCATHALAQGTSSSQVQEAHCCGRHQPTSKDGGSGHASGCP